MHADEAGPPPDPTIAPTASLRDALVALNLLGTHMVVVVDSGRRCVGTVTDGDLRRAILRGLSLDARVEEAMTRDPTVASAELSLKEQLDVMLAGEVDQLPLVDADGRVTGLRQLVDFPRSRLGSRRRTEPGRVVLLAGGEGRRLRPLTAATPKPMLCVGGRPLLETLVEGLAEQGLRRMTIAVKYLADSIESYFADGRSFGVEIGYVRETTSLGTAGPVRLAAGNDDAPVLVVNGDILTTFNYRRFIEHHQQSNNHMTLAMVPIDTGIPYGVLQLDDWEVTGIIEKPQERCFVSGGIYLLEPEVVRGIEPDARVDMPDVIARALADGLKVGGFPVTEFWRDIGHHDDYAAAGKDYQEHFA